MSQKVSTFSSSKYTHTVVQPSFLPSCKAFSSSQIKSSFHLAMSPLSSLPLAPGNIFILLPVAVNLPSSRDLTEHSYICSFALAQCPQSSSSCSTIRMSCRFTAEYCSTMHLRHMRHVVLIHPLSMDIRVRRDFLKTALEGVCMVRRGARTGWRRRGWGRHDIKCKGKGRSAVLRRDAS